MSLDPSQLWTFIGGAVAAYIAVRVGLASVSTEVRIGFQEINRRMDKHDTAGTEQDKRIGSVEKEYAALRAEFDAFVRDTYRSIGGE